MKRISSCWPVLILALILCACWSPRTVSGETRELRIADGKGDWGLPNPFHHYPRGPGYLRMSWTFDTLIWKDRSGFVPALARQWSYDPDTLAFTFRLHPRALWHDGREVRAADVVFTLKYLQRHPYPWVSLDRVQKAEALDSKTVRIVLTKPYAPFLSDIGGTMPILPKHIWQDVTNPRQFRDPAAFIGSGPYCFRDFDKTQGTYLFEAFANYYQGRPRAERLIYVRTGKPLISLLRGQVDLANIRPEMAEPLREKGLTVIENERGWNKKLMINHRKSPLDRKLFRQALALAIDRQELIDKAHRGFAHPASFGLLSIDHPMYAPKTPSYPHNPEKARTYIRRLGYSLDDTGFFTKNGRPLSLELLSSNLGAAGENAAYRDGEIIKKQLESVGIRVDLRSLEQSTADNRIKHWDFDLAVSGHGGIAGDPKILNEMISPVYGAGSVNSARYDANERLNRLLEEQMRSMEPEKRREIVQEIQILYARELPAISLYYPDTLAAYRPQTGVDWFYTPGGISKGIPIPQNKMALIP